MKVQILFKDNPTPLTLNMDRKIYDDIIKGVRSKNSASFMWGEDEDDVSSFLFRTESVIAISILDPTEEEGEGKGKGAEEIKQE